MSETPDPQHGSVSAELSGLKRNDAAAVTYFWNAYFTKLRQQARRKLKTFHRGAADSEDVALDVFESLCRGASAGRFPELNNREDLWRILLTLTHHKSVDLLRAEKSLKRGGGKVREFSVLDKTKASDRKVHVFDPVAGDPGPEVLVVLDDYLQELMSALPDNTYRQIAQMKIELHTVDEIAERVGFAPRSIERKLVNIRLIWSRELAKFEESES